MGAVEIKAKIFGGFLSAVGHLPLKVLYKFGDFAAWFMCRVLNYRKAEVYINLSRSFPNMPYGRIKEICNEYYRHLGEIIAETIWFAGCKGRPERLRKQGLFEYTNIDILMEAHKKGPVMCMKSHTGNWEVLGGIFEYNRGAGFHDSVALDEIYVVYKPLSSKVFDLVFSRNRASVLSGYKGMLPDSKLLRHIIKHKDDKYIYMLITDQFPYYACHYVGTFLNQPTQGKLGTFELAHKLGFTVFYMREERDGRGRY